MSTFERTKTPAPASRSALTDGTLRIPESGNAVPDVLDEARWELEFLLTMQVPAGQPLAGMAHHKIHDAAVDRPAAAAARRPAAARTCTRRRRRPR